jgi:hypothetical protein
MKMTTTDGVAVDIPADAILAAAGAIYAARRKTHGHPPLRVFRCRWCDGEVRGRNALDQHERGCESRPTGEMIGMTDDDWIALGWTPGA